MSRWEVYRTKFLTGGWGEWAACNDDAPTRYFLTWREALDYADRMARTREYVLPRYSLTPRNKSGAFWGARKRGNDYAVFRIRDFRETQVIHVSFADLRPLALALLALAERENA